MKKIYNILAIFLVVLLLTGCTKKNEEIIDAPKDDNTNVITMLNDVLNNRKTFVTNTQQNVTINEYKINETERTIVDKYAYTDLNGDSIYELVVLTLSDYGAYLIFYYDKEDDNVYGYEIGIRSFEELKTDGTFKGASGAGLLEYSSISFSKENYIITALASEDDINGTYTIDNKTATESEMLDYINTFDNKTSVEFKSLIAE